MEFQHFILSTHRSVNRLYWMSWHLNLLLNCRHYSIKQIKVKDRFLKQGIDCFSPVFNTFITLFGRYKTVSRCKRGSERCVAVKRGSQKTKLFMRKGHHVEVTVNLSAGCFHRDCFWWHIQIMETVIYKIKIYILRLYCSEFRVSFKHLSVPIKNQQ